MNQEVLEFKDREEASWQQREGKQQIHGFDNKKLHFLRIALLLIPFKYFFFSSFLGGGGGGGGGGGTCRQ